MLLRPALLVAPQAAWMAASPAALLALRSSSAPLHPMQVRRGVACSRRPTHSLVYFTALAVATPSSMQLALQCAGRGAALAAAAPPESLQAGDVFFAPAAAHYALRVASHATVLAACMADAGGFQPALAWARMWGSASVAHARLAEGLASPTLADWASRQLPVQQQSGLVDLRPQLSALHLTRRSESQ